MAFENINTGGKSYQELINTGVTKRPFPNSVKEMLITTFHFY